MNAGGAKRRRIGTVCVTLLGLTLLIGAPGVVMTGCDAGAGFLGLQDYQRDLLFGFGGLAIRLLGGGSAVSGQGAGQALDNGCSVEANPDGSATVTCVQNGETTTTVINSGVDGNDCSIEDNGDGTATLQCTDGTQVVLENGSNGADGADGVNGAAGSAGPAGDRGSRGAQGSSGSSGADGAPGMDGMNGLSCWDLNENGKKDFCDPAVQDVDGMCPPQYDSCYLTQTGSNGLIGFTEDVNGDCVIDVNDCSSVGPQGPQGLQGPQGPVGPQGPQGPAGPSGGGLFNSVFIDDFFTLPTGSYDGLLLNPGDELPVLRIQEPALGNCNCDDYQLGGGPPPCTGVVAYRAPVPQRYTPGNPITMRLYFWRQGPITDNCFVLRLDAFRAVHAEDIVEYGPGDNTRYIRLDTSVVNPDGTLLVVDLPLNTGDGTGATGLGFPDPAPGELLAFELNTLDNEDFMDGGCYTIMGVDFFESAADDDTVAVTNATVFTDLSDRVCNCFSECPAVDMVFVMDTSGSMQNEGDALCAQVADVVDELQNQFGIDLVYSVLAIHPNRPADLFDCLSMDMSVAAVLGESVPGTDTCPGDLGGILSDRGSMEKDENWGPATAIVADRFGWLDGAIRIVVPISDEGPCLGSGPTSDLEGCSVTDNSDDASAVTNAISIANANGVLVSPITGDGSSACVKFHARRIAESTGGQWFDSTNPQADLAGFVSEIALGACERFCEGQGGQQE